MHYNTHCELDLEAEIQFGEIQPPEPCLSSNCGCEVTKKYDNLLMGI